MFGHLRLNVTNLKHIFIFKAVEFFIFAGLMVVTIGIYSVMAFKYQYVDYSQEEEEEEEEEEEVKVGTLDIKEDRMNGHVGVSEPIAMVYNPEAIKMGIVNRGFEFTDI